MNYRHGVLVYIALIVVTPTVLGHEGINHSSTAEANEHRAGTDFNLPYEGVRPVAWIVYGFLTLVTATTVLALIKYRRERQLIEARKEQVLQDDDR